MKISASACAKAILFGEHAVIYTSPSIAIPIKSLLATVSVSDSDSLAISSRNLAKEEVISKKLLEKEHELYPLQETVRNTLKHFSLPLKQNIHVSVDSHIPIASGLGSGAAVAVATIRALARYFKKKITNEDLYNLAFKTEELHHGNPSRVDLTVIINEKPVFFKREPRTIEILQIKQPLHFIMADSGIPSKTSDVVSAVQQNKEKYGEQLAEIRTITEHAHELLLAGDTSRLGSLMYENHEALEDMDVSSPELDALVSSARNAGALGAKLTGAGRGGHMIALVSEQRKELAQMLMDAGAVNVFYADLL